MAAAASVHARSIRITSSRRSVVRSNAAKCNRSRVQGEDSCLVRSEEGQWRRPVRRPGPG